jgi:hypothetical protein
MPLDPDAVALQMRRTERRLMAGFSLVAAAIITVALIWIS